MGKQNSKHRSCRLKCEPLPGNCRIIQHNDGGRKLRFDLLSVTTGQLLSLTCMLNNKLLNDAAAFCLEVTDMINGVLNIHPHTSSSSMCLYLVEQLQSLEER